MYKSKQIRPVNCDRFPRGWRLLFGEKVAAVILLIILVPVLSGCYTKRIEEAFDGEFPPGENNKIISEYCQSCHIHRNFDPSFHVEEMALQYNRKVFRYATECRTCHYLEKQFTLNDFTRKTRRPEEANRGKFRDFEREMMDAKKKRARRESGNGSSFLGIF